MRQEHGIAMNFTQVFSIQNWYPSSKDGALATIFAIPFITKLTSAACKPIEHMAYWI